MGGDFIDLNVGASITGFVIGAVFCAMAVWPSLFPRITSTDKEDVS